MRSIYRITGALLILVGSLGAPVLAQTRSCADSLTVSGTTICVNFSVLPGTASGHSVSVHETFSAGNKLAEKNVIFETVPGAAVSRTIDDMDISAILPGKTLHDTLRYTAATGSVTLDRSLLLPGAIPLK